jgi:hypothetical protein
MQLVGCTSGRPNCYCRTGRTRAILRVALVDSPDDDDDDKNKTKTKTKDGNGSSPGEADGGGEGGGGDSESATASTESFVVLEYYCSQSSAADKLGLHPAQVCHALANRHPTPHGGHLLR